MQKTRTRFIHPILMTAGIMILGLSACEDKQEPIPAYLNVASAQFSADASTQGYATHAITDAWVYADSNLIGGFELGRPFPILETGITTIEVFPGIKDNGIKATPEIYPFYTTYKTSVDLAEARIDTIHAQFTYQPGLSFPLRDNFDNNTIIQTDLDGDSTTNLEINHTEAIYGTGCGHFIVSKDHPVLRVASNFVLSGLPVLGGPVYIELDYKAETRFVVGLIGYIPGGTTQAYDVIVINPKESWNKIYINLSEILYQTQYSDYKVYFSSVYQGDSLVNPVQHVYVDNLKVVHYK